MKFSSAFLDEIRARVTISSVVGRRVTWDRRKSHPSRGDLWACCPFHEEKTASFHVEDRKGRYHCFGCKASGDIFTFLVEKEGLAFPEAVERLAGEAGLPLPRATPEDTAREERRASLHEVMEEAARFYEAELRSPRASEARAYLARRGLDDAVQRAFRIGYAPDSRSALRSHLAAKNVTLEQMIDAGLLVAGEDIPVAYDRFRDRVMFPICDARGRVIAFGGRALGKDVQAKYLNSPETPLFSKGRTLYNLHRARGPAHEAGEIVAVEGYVDVIAMHRAGLAHAVAPLGTALTEDQLRMLWRIAPTPVLCFDGDAAGLKAAHRAADLALPLLEPGHSLRFALLPEGQDPDDLLASAGPDALRAVVGAATALSDLLWERERLQARTDTPDGRAMFEVRLLELAGQIRHDTVRRHYVEDMKRRLGEEWAPSRGRGAGMRRAGRFAPKPPRPVVASRCGPRGRPLAHDFPLQPGTELKGSALAGRAAPQSARREGLILLGLVNHPELLDDIAELLADAEFAARPLDSLRREILDVAALREGLDGPALRGHLLARGFGPLLGRIEAQAVRLNEWFLSAGAASADARTGLMQIIALHRKRVSLERQLEAAEAALAAEPTEANLARLNEVREELASQAGAEAQIEGFGEASGRPAPALT